MAEALDKTSETPSKFIVSRKALADKFRVDQHRRQALDRIEHAITTRTLGQSLHFYDRLNIPIYKITSDDISYHYKLPIPNGQADIPKTYLEYREHLKWLTYEIEERLTIIDKIMHESDPRAALAEREKLEEYRGGSSWRDGLTFSTRKINLDWPYLVEALDEHDTRIAALKAAGKFEIFLDLSHARRKLCDWPRTSIRPTRRGNIYGRGWTMMPLVHLPAIATGIGLAHVSSRPRKSPTSS